jgi:polypeptide N-acetylgalactosaminyltransferase
MVECKEFHLVYTYIHWFNQVILRNKARAAVVWMDEYKDIALNLMHLPKNFDLGPLEYMTDLRKRLQCKPFKWLLDNIYPESMHRVIHVIIS